MWREEQEQEQHEDQPMATPREAPTMTSDDESIPLPLPEPEAGDQLVTHAEEDEGRSVNVDGQQVRSHISAAEGETDCGSDRGKITGTRSESSFTANKGSVLPGGAGKALAEVSSLFFCV